MKKGISLIVLVITIIVIIILAGAVILSLSNNNPIEQANEAVFKSNVGTYNSELAMAISNKYLEDNYFVYSSFDANIWDGSANISGTIKEYIKSITKEDGAKFQIQAGKLVYVGNDQIEKDWLIEIGIVSGSISDTTAPTVLYSTNGVANIQTATTAVTLSDESGINSSTLQYVWDTQNSVTPVSGWASFTNDAILTKGSVTGTYYLWIKAEDSIGNSVITKSNAFLIDNTAPIAPTPVITSATGSYNPGQVITVSITYSADTVIKEYSTDGVNWNIYITSVQVTDNCTVYARGKDAAGNQSAQGSVVVDWYDSTPPIG
ncbi:MAG: hypothetical protein K0R72_1295 [Clostridia bacterium]|jgi:Tfp pilus assembly protein PilE|nr:hypothetical protein [Clostridia bacterium]